MNKLFNLPIGVPRSLTLLKFDISDPTYKAAVKTNESNERIAKETNETNIQLTRETNQANKDIQQMANDLQVQESEKAYQRSTPTNQIAELVRSGFSTQQAMSIVAGSGSPATYQPAPIGAAQMVAPQAQPYTVQPAVDNSLSYWLGIAQQSFDLLKGVGDSFTQDDGGAAGNLYASSALSFINENAVDIYNQSGGSVNTLMDFRNFCMSQPEGSKYRDFIESDKWKRVMKFPPAARAVNSNMQQMFADNRTTSQQIEAAQKDLENQAIKNRIDLVTADIAEHGLDLAFLRQDQEQANLPTLMQADYELALKSIAEASLDSSIANNPEYRKQRIAVALQNEKTQFITAEVLQLKQQIMKNGIGSLSDEQKQFLGVYSCYDSFGLTASDYTAALSFMEASGISVSEMLRSAVDWLKSKFNHKDLPDEAVDGVPAGSKVAIDKDGNVVHDKNGRPKVITITPSVVNINDPTMGLGL